MGRKPLLDRSPEEKRQTVPEGLKSGNVSEPCRLCGNAQTLYYHSRDEAEQGAKAALRGETLLRPKPRRIPASGSWSGPWAGSRLRLKSSKTSWGDELR